LKAGVKILGLIFAFVSLTFAFNLHGSTKGFPKKAPEIEGLLTDEGKPFSLKELKGKVILITYGYTQCPHVCPTITAFLKQVETQLNKKGYKDKYKIVFITVDPKDDTVEKLREYKKKRGFEDWIFLTGDKEKLKKVWKNYGVYVKDKGIMEMKHQNHIMKHRMIDHTAKLTVINQKGEIVEEFKSMYLPVEDIVKDVSYLIEKGE
jgi:protein SCO1/2